MKRWGKLRATVTKADVTSFGDDFEIDFRMNYEVTDPSCQYTQIRAIQLIGRHKYLSGDPANPKDDKKRLTTRSGIDERGGWRIDWSDEESQIKVPFLDEGDLGTPVTDENKVGTTKDPGLRLKTNRRHRGYTCFIAVEKGIHRFLGCVHWGAKRKGDMITGDPLKPEWTCTKPSDFNAAVVLWNHEHGKHAIPDIPDPNKTNAPDIK